MSERPQTVFLFIRDGDAVTRHVVGIDDLLIQTANVLFDGDDADDLAEIEVRRSDGTIVYLGIRPDDTVNT